MPDEFKLQIYLARHGETWGNLAFSTGQENSPKTEADSHDPQLTPWGLRQAQLLGERLSLQRFDAIFCSTLVRAVSTAYETSVRQPQGPVPVELLWDLVETGTPWNYTGYSIEEIQSRYPAVVSSRFLQGTAADRITEELKDAQMSYMNRATQCIAYFRDRFQNGEKIFVVAHGGFNTYITRAALGLDNSNDFNFCQENTGLTKIKYFLDDKARLSYSNDTSHLYAEKKLLTFSL